MKETVEEQNRNKLIDANKEFSFSINIGHSDFRENNN